MINVAESSSGSNTGIYVELGTFGSRHSEPLFSESETELEGNFLSETHGMTSHFQAQYECDFYHEFPETVAVGYAAGSKSSRSEAKEEALYLSEALGGILVSGVYRKGYGCNGSHSEAVRRIRAIWKSFFSTRGRGTFIQYYNHDAGEYVSEAYQSTPYQSYIILVGVNAYIAVGSPRSYLFRTRWDLEMLMHRVLRKTYEVCRETLLPVNPSAANIFSLRFIDPTFLESIQFIFQKVVQHHVESNVSSYTISPAIAALLSVPSPFGKTTTVARAFNTDLFSQVEVLTACSEVFHSVDDMWPRERTMRVTELFLALMRAVDYGTALVDACVNPCIRGALLQGALACSAVFWSMLSLGLSFLLSDRTFFKRSFSHTVVLIWSGFSPVINAIELLFFAYQCLQMPERYIVIFSQCACSFIGTMLCSLRGIRQLGYRMAGYLTGDSRNETNAVHGILSEQEEDFRSEVKYVNKCFQKEIESQRIFLSFLKIAIAGGMCLTRYIACSSFQRTNNATTASAPCNESSTTIAYVGGDIFRAVCCFFALLMLVLFPLVRRFSEK